MPANRGSPRPCSDFSTKRSARAMSGSPTPRLSRGTFGRPAIPDPEVVMSRSLIIHGGPILTMDNANPIVDAVGIDIGIVVATGTETEVRERMPAGAESIHLDGRLATPGLYDAHAHTMMTG